LGRGLSALIGETDTSFQESHSEKIHIINIEPNPEQPRMDINPESLQELAASISAHGLIQPVIVRKHPEKDGKYQLIAGERRWRAAGIAGLKEVPVIVTSANNEEMLVLALIENLQRENLNPVDEAESFSQLQNRFNMTHEEISRHVGKQRTTISNTLRLLDLPSSVLNLVRHGDLSAGHARALLGLGNPAAIEKLADQAFVKGWSVRQTEEAVREFSKAKKKKLSGGIQTSLTDPYVSALEEKLERFFGTRVKLLYFKNKKGKLEIHYYSNEDLSRILNMIGVSLD
jgi:ParB family chromosome partitioning protein